MSIKPEELKPCPFCGSAPEFPEVSEVFGTCYEAGCNECSMATISIQIIDRFHYGESPNRDDAYNSWDVDALKYGDEFIGIVRSEAIKEWNTRAIPDTHRVVSVELLEEAVGQLSELNTFAAIRAIIEDKENKQ
jgi:hypothetical protein